MRKQRIVWKSVIILILAGMTSLAWAGTYSGGTGDPNDPYQIATAQDLIDLGETPADYDKHFILTADIDLDPNLPDGKTFDRAVIAPDVEAPTSGFQGTEFSGSFNGDGFTIQGLTISGGEYGFYALFGTIGAGAQVQHLRIVNANISFGSVIGSLAGSNRGFITNCYSTGTVNGKSSVGGLVGANLGILDNSYSMNMVDGQTNVGGLVGYNNGHDDLVGLITNSYSTSTVNANEGVGGLVGYSNHGGSVTTSYSIGTVSGNVHVGGFMGRQEDGSVTTDSFWDTETTGQSSSAGGTGLTTAEMQDINTYLNAGWDFVGEPNNGTEDIWTMPENDYPRLTWEFEDVNQTTNLEDGFETGDFSSLAWTHQGIAWQVTDQTAFSGEYSARSGLVGDQESSTLSLTCDCAVGEIRFAVKVSSEDKYDELVFRIDDQEVASFSGEQAWIDVNYPVTAGSHTLSWSYEKDISKYVGQDAAWIDEVSIPIPEPTSSDGFEGGDFTALAWEPMATAWQVTDTEARSGTYSARSGTIQDNEISGLLLTHDCQAGSIGFAVKISSEDQYDKLVFLIDDQEIAAFSGEQAWIDVNYPVTAGTHTFIWSYEKDKSLSLGQDAAWIDDVVLPGHVLSIDPSLLFAEDFEDGNYDGWAIGNEAFTRQVTDQTSAEGSYCFTLIGGDGGTHHNGISHELSDIVPDRIEFYVQSSSTAKIDGYFVVGESSDNSDTAVFFGMKSDGTMGIYDEEIWHSIPYNANEWYKIYFIFDWVGKEVDFYANDELVESGIPFRGTTVNILKYVYLYNVTAGSQAWWDDIKFIDDRPL